MRQPQLHQAQRVLLIGGIGLGQMQALLPAAQIGVAGRDLGRNGTCSAARSAALARRSALPASMLRRTRPNRSSSQLALMPAL
jgi:hypothetical protein